MPDSAAQLIEIDTNSGIPYRHLTSGAYSATSHDVSRTKDILGLATRVANNNSAREPMRFTAEQLFKIEVSAMRGHQSNRMLPSASYSSSGDLSSHGVCGQEEGKEFEPRTVRAG